MKKIFTLLFAVVMVSTMSAQSKFTKSPLPLQVAQAPQVLSHRASITPADNQVWWGYVTGDTEVSGLGVQAADTYHCAIFIPGNQAVASGKTIKAIRFGLAANNKSDVKVWLASTLPATPSAENTLQLVDVSTDDLANIYTDVALPEGYTIPEAGVYVGYSFTITAAQTENDYYPILTTGNDTEHGMYLRTANAVKTWSNMNGQGYGSLFMQVLLEGTFEQYSATPYSINDTYMKVGEQTTQTLVVMNGGLADITSIDYTITSNGVTGAEQHADLTMPIAFNSYGEVSIPVASDDSQKKATRTLTITKVNGQENKATANTLDMTVYSLSEIIDRNVVVEQFTGTGCGWCPRGHVGMAKMDKTYGNRFVGIALHQYSGQSNDAMYIARNAYAPLSFGGAPSCQIDRVAEIDPYYGSNNDILEDFAEEMAIPAMVDVQVSGEMSADKATVAAKATVRPLFEGTYKLEFVLTADGLSGTGTGWNQANYYYQYSSSQLPADLAEFGNGGKYGKSPISGLTFNDVAIASSYKNSTNQVEALTLTAGETKEVEYTLTMPTYAKLKTALQSDKAKVYIVALLVAADGHILQAAQKQISGEGTGIKTVQSAEGRGQSYYNLSGQRVQNPSKGLYIVNGKKVLVK